MPGRIEGVRRYRGQRRSRARIAVAAAVAVVIAAGVALAVTRGDHRSLPHAVSLVGDSLNVGVEPYLAAELHDWRLSTDDVPGRATAEGLDAVRRAGGGLHSHVLVSLGTNDISTGVDTFRADVREALSLAGPHRCVVWFTIFRAGEQSIALNDVLREEANRAANLRLVDWAALVRAHPNWLSADGIHATPAGYAARARAAATALQAC
jgi:lysophospholipase L1-like esterase